VTLGCPKGVFRGCAPEGAALKWLLFYLSVVLNRIRFSSIGYDRPRRSTAVIVAPTRNRSTMTSGRRVIRTREWRLSSDITLLSRFDPAKPPPFRFNWVARNISSWGYAPMSQKMPNRMKPSRRQSHEFFARKPNFERAAALYQDLIKRDPKFPVEDPSACRSQSRLSNNNRPMRTPLGHPSATRRRPGRRGEKGLILLTNCQQLYFNTTTSSDNVIQKTTSHNPSI
jgi:hypothetical protein